MVSRKRVTTKNQKVLRAIFRHRWWWCWESGQIAELNEHLKVATQEGYSIELRIYLYLAQIWYLMQFAYPLDKWKSHNSSRMKVYHQKYINRKHLAQRKEDVKAFKEALQDEVLLY